MATLEMVPLRSRYPHTGRVTLRHAMPAFDIDLAIDEVLKKTTTPQVVETVPADTRADDETTARKGGEAR